ncbi:MAG: hypothetical protein V3V19_11345 [Cocleimonas sp.]
MDTTKLNQLIKRLGKKSVSQVEKAKKLNRSYSKSVTVRRDTFMKIYNSELFKTVYKSGTNAGPREFNQYLDKSVNLDVVDLKASCYYDPENKEFYYIDCYYNSMNFTY